VVDIHVSYIDVQNLLVDVNFFLFIFASVFDPLMMDD